MSFKDNREDFKTKNGGRFSTLDCNMMKSPIGEILKKNAYAFLIFSIFNDKYIATYSKGLCIKSNRNNLSLPRSEYKKYMVQKTFEKAIDLLIELGLIKLVVNGYPQRIANIYGFSCEWKNYNTKQFNVKNKDRRVNVNTI